MTWPAEANAAKIALTWADNSSNEDGFKIEQKIGTTGTFTQIAVVGPDTTSYIDKGVANGTITCYRVRAFNTNGDSGYSNETCNGAEVTSPAPGSTLSSSSVTFIWNSGAGIVVSEYWLSVGTTPGSSDIYNGSQGTNLSRTVTGLPTDGSTVYVRMWSKIDGNWPLIAYTYTAATITTLAAPVLSATTPKCNGTSPGIELQWSAVSGANQYEIYSSGSLIATTSSAGSTFLNVGLTAGQSYTYQVKAKSGTITSNLSNSVSATAPNCSTSTLAELTSPAPGSTLSSSSVTFIWSSGTGVSAYWLSVGTTQGHSEIYNGSQGTSLSRTVTGLPTDGSTVYVRMWSEIDGNWPLIAYTYSTTGGFTPVLASAATSLITAVPASIDADGTSTSSITVQLKDSSGKNLTTGGDSVTLSTNLGTLGTVSDNGNGTYTATLISSTTAGTATITGTVNGSVITDKTTVSFVSLVTFVTFSTPDLAGTWYYYGYSDFNSSNDPGWRRGTLTLNSSGAVTDGSWVDSDGTSVTISSGSLSLDGTGVGSGSVTDSSGVTTTLSQFKMDSNKTIATGVSIDSDNYRAMGGLIKDGGTFSVNDLAGTWYFYGFSDLSSSNDPGWSRAALTVDSSGSVTGGNWVDSDGSSVTIIGGSLSLDSTGVGSGSFADSSGVTTLLPHFKMDSNKTIAAGVSIDSVSYRGTGVLVKDGGTFSTNDLTGTWYFYGFSDLISSNDPGWSRATLTLDSSGSVAGGNWIDSDGSSVTISGGSLSLDSTGVGSGSFTDSSGVTTTLSQFKMDSNKTIATGVSIDSDNYRGMGVLIKGVGILIDTGSLLAQLTSPTPGSTLSSSSVTFTWSSGTGVSEYWLSVGTTPEFADIYNGSQGTNLSRTVTGLPTDGSTVYVRMWSKIDGEWPLIAYTY